MGASVPVRHRAGPRKGHSGAPSWRWPKSSATWVPAVQDNPELPDEGPQVIVDGQGLSWAEFGELLKPYNGWSFELRLGSEPSSRDASDTLERITVRTPIEESQSSRSRPRTQYWCLNPMRSFASSTPPPARTTDSRRRAHPEVGWVGHALATIHERITQKPIQEIHMSTTSDAQTAAPSSAALDGQIERANATDRTPVVFVHGLWLLPISRNRWADLFEEAG